MGTESSKVLPNSLCVQGESHHHHQSAGGRSQSGNLPRKQAHTQLIREHSATIVSACWATVDWSWIKRVELVCMSWSPLKKKKKKVWVGTESSKVLPNSLCVQGESHHHHHLSATSKEVAKHNHGYFWLVLCIVYMFTSSGKTVRKQ